jgi:hypothetical protein
MPEKETPVGNTPDRRPGEKVMMHHHSLLPKIVVILRIRVKIIIRLR